MIRPERSLKFPHHARWLTSAVPQALPGMSRRQHALLKLKHPHIGPMYAYRESHQPRVGCELLPGATLADRLRWRRCAPYTLSEVLHLLAPIAEALEYAQAQGVVHGNLHPAAIVYVNTRPVLTGFVGTAAPGPEIYRAPEHCSDQIRSRGDVYALAVIAHELLTGYPPSIQASDATALPAAIDRVLARALARQPRQRYHSPLAFVHALQAAQHRIRRKAAAKTGWRRYLSHLSLLTTGAIVLSGVAGALSGFLG